MELAVYIVVGFVAVLFLVIGIVFMAKKTKSMSQKPFANNLEIRTVKNTGSSLDSREIFDLTEEEMGF